MNRLGIVLTFLAAVAGAEVFATPALGVAGAEVFASPGSRVGGPTPEEKKATVAFLRGLQNPDGGFLAAPTSPADKSAPASSLRATSAALRALKYFGGEPRDRAACVKFVQSCYHAEAGAFADTPITSRGVPDVIVSAVGLMAVVELKMPREPYVAPTIKYLEQNAGAFEEIRMAAAGLETVGASSPRAARWLDFLSKMRNPDGTFGKGDGAARDTGGAVCAVLRLGGKLDQRPNVLKTLKAGQRADGGFGKHDAPASDLETTYRVVRAFVMLKETPADVERMRGFIAKCRNDDGGYGVAPRRQSTVSATYFAGIVLHWLEGK
jgi:prenyltransferase beta subunit